MVGRRLGSYFANEEGRLYRGGAELTSASDRQGTAIELGPAQRDLLAVLVEVGPTPAPMDTLAARLRKRRPSANAVETCRLAWKRLRRFLAALDDDLGRLVVHPAGGARRRGLYGLRFADDALVAPAAPTPPAAVANLPSMAYLFARSPIPTYVTRHLGDDARPEQMPILWANEALQYLARWDAIEGRTVEDLIEHLFLGNPSAAEAQVQVLDELGREPPPEASGDVYQLGPVVFDRGRVGKRSVERWHEPLRLTVLGHWVRDAHNVRTHVVVQYIVTDVSSEAPLLAHDTGPWWRSADLSLRRLQELDQLRLAGQLDAAAHANARREILSSPPAGRS